MRILFVWQHPPRPWSTLFHAPLVLHLIMVGLLLLTVMVLASALFSGAAIAADAAANGEVRTLPAMKGLPC